MYYIIFDLEFNQDFSSLQYYDKKLSHNIFEIVQFGAVMLDSDLNTISDFNRYIKPSIYLRINPFITNLTGITTEKLIIEEPFTEVYRSFIEFIGGKDSIFCTWGMSDIKELFRNVEFFRLNDNLLPRRYINLQPYVSQYQNLSSGKLLRLQSAVELLGIPAVNNFHNALHDAYYTAEILKKIYSTPIEPKVYDPSFVRIKPRYRKKEIDFDGLIKQFEKMYTREMTEEEQGMIKLAYKMGKTGQFIK